jgi:8-oxo-dGTP pyrophosphatase MutT (NUDIX family)
MSEKVMTWKKVSSEKLAECRIFKIWCNHFVSSKDEKEADFYMIENPDWINVIALTPDEKVILVEQFRHGIENISLEIPSGVTENGEDPKTAAIRELREETGYEPREVISIGKVHVNPAIQNNSTHYFLALDCERKHETDFDEHEDIATRLVPLSEIPKLIEEEKIAHSIVVAGFHRFEMYRQKEASK